MAGPGQTGPTCGHNNPVNVIDGTLCRAASPPPDSVGFHPFDALTSSAYSLGAEFEEAKTHFSSAMHSAERHLRSDYEGAKCIYSAYLQALELAPEAILKETGYEIASLLSGLIPGLLQMVVIVGATTFLGAAIGGIVGFFFGGVGAIPGVAVGGEIGLDVGVAILTWLGLAFLVISMAKGFGEMIDALRNGIEWAWAARNLHGTDEAKQVSAGAHELARTVGILMRLVLQAIVVYLLKKAAVGATRGALTTAKAVRADGAAAVSEATVAELVAKLRTSKFGGRFGDWVDNNWRDMVKNPRLREAQAPKPSLGTGGRGDGAGDLPRSKPASEKPPAADAAEAEKPDLSTNAKKGVFGEAKADAYMKQQGYKKLNGPDVQVGDAPKGAGIDGVYENLSPPPKYVVADAKFGSSPLGQTADGTQMSENWVDNRLNKAVGRATADDIRVEGYDRMVLKVDEAGTVTPKIVSEDAAGKITLSDPPPGG